MIIKKKIIFGITSLTIGGAERVLVDLANKLCCLYDITIFSIYDNGELKKELNGKVKFKSLYKCTYNELSKIQKKWIPIKILLFANSIYKRHIKCDYDIEVAFLEGPITRLFSKKNVNTRKIVWVHNDIKYVFGSNIKSKIKKIIDKIIYTRYDDIVFVSSENKKSFCSVYKNMEFKRLHIIHNYIDSKRVMDMSVGDAHELKKCNSIIFVCVCRLVKQKAIDRLISIHKKLINDGLMHNFFVIGDGPERHNLEHLIELEKVEKTFHILGKRDNPYPYIKNADYFCLLSYFEGYGMVLEEAKILEKPIIITDTAAKEAAEGYNYSLIIGNNNDSIYDGLSNVILHKELFKKKEYSYSNKTNLDEVIKLLDG